MATLDDLERRVTSNAQIKSNESINSEMVRDFLIQALYRHAPEFEGDFSLLPAVQEEPVVLLAWISICYARASKAAPEVNLNITRTTSTSMGQDRSTPVDKNIKLAQALEARYKAITEAVGGTTTTVQINFGDIQQGELYRENSLTDATTETAVKILTASVLSIGTPVANEVVLSWTGNADSNFQEYIVFQSLTSGIYQSWNNSSSSGVPLISNSASKLIKFTDRFKLSIKVSDLTSATTYYYLIVTKSTNGRYVYSNEVSVSNP